MASANKPVIYFVFRSNKGATSTRFGGFAKRLQKTGHMPDADYKTVALEDLIFTIGTNGYAAIIDQNGVEQFADADFVYFKSWEAVPELASMVVSYLSAKGVPFEDAAVAHAGIHKPSQTWKLWSAGVRVVPTIVCSIPPSRQVVEKCLGAAPYIVKPAKGEKGKGVELLETFEQVAEKLGDGSSDWVVQTYIPNEGDYRVMVYGYEVRGALYRQAADGLVVNNTSQGGSSDYLEAESIPRQVAKMAVIAARAVEHAVAGVDVVSDSTGVAYVFEVNQGSQIVTGHFTDKKMAAFGEYLSERIETRFARKKPNNRLRTIGRYVTVNLPDLGIKGIFAKVDTGAYQSSIHATNIKEVETPDGTVLEFTVLEGHHKAGAAAVSSRAAEYEKTAIKNSFGGYQTRYVIQTRIAINGRMMKTGITLADRKEMVAPILLGRRFLRGRYLVNVEMGRKSSSEML